MLHKRSVIVALGVSGALVASSTAFAVANGIFGDPRPDRVGTFQAVEQQLLPAESPAPTSAAGGPAAGTRPPEDDTATAPGSPSSPTTDPPDVGPRSTMTPTTRSTVSTVPEEREHHDGRDNDD